MGAAKLKTLEAEAQQATLLAQGLAEQARLRGLLVETFGQPETNTHLIQKLRNMDPQLRATITAK